MTKFMKAILTGVAATGMLAVVAPMQAQAPDAPPAPQGPPPGGGGMRGGRGGGGPEQRLAMLQQQLNLTPDQSTKIKAILEDGRTKMMALRQDTTVSQEDKRTQMMGMMKTENESIKAVLTPDQKAQFKAMEEKQRERRRDGGGPGGPGGPGGGNGAPPPPPPPAPPAK